MKLSGFVAGSGFEVGAGLLGEFPEFGIQFGVGRRKRLDLHLEGLIFLAEAGGQQPADANDFVGQTGLRQCLHDGPELAPFAAQDRTRPRAAAQLSRHPVSHLSRFVLDRLRSGYLDPAGRRGGRRG